MVRYEHDQREGPAAHTSWEFMLSREDVLAFSTTQPLRASQPVREDEAVARALARALGCALYPADYEAGDEGSHGAPDGREGQEQARFGGDS